jgi:hypothetical protein
MTAPLRQQRLAIDPLAVFTARCEARALLWHTGELDLHTAIDELWAAAMHDGLVAKLGPDKVQELLANAFAPQRDDLPSDREDQVATSDNLNSADDTWSAPGWRDAAIEYHKDRGKNVSTVCYTPDELDRLRKLLDDDVSLERAWHEINKRADAADSTVEALMFSLRERGVAALSEPETRRRLANLSSAQVREVLARLIALRPTYPAIDDDLLFLLGEQIS